MARVLKMTTARLGHHDIDWLRQLAEQDGDDRVVELCRVAKSIEGPGLRVSQIRAARKSVVDEINRRSGWVGKDARPTTPVAVKSPAQLDAEIDAALRGPVTIVVAWIEDTQDLAPGQKTWRHDLGERPKLVDVKKPHAAMWLNSGSVDDVAKARRYVKNDHPDSGRVFAYPTTEPDPLGRARREVRK